MMTLSIVLLTYNRLARLQRTLEQLLPQCAAHDVLVCDNASSDGTHALMAEITGRHSNVRYQRNAVNVGYARNLFTGFVAATGTHVLFLADDDIIPAGFVAELEVIVAANAKAGVIIPSRRRAEASGPVTDTLRVCGTKFIPSSARALEEAFAHSGAVPGLVVRTDAVRGSDWILDGTIYPQIGLACHLAAREGLVLADIANSIICLETDGIASRIKDAMNRPSDYGLIERAQIADGMAIQYPTLLGDADLLKRPLWGWAFDVFEEMGRVGMLSYASQTYLPALLAAPTCGQSASFLFLWFQRARRQRGFLSASLSPMLRHMPKNIFSPRFFGSLVFWLRR
ncbi:MAG TPA: glycosyltransferase family 2 protein [Rhizomicrobium sp.]|nr:glycosyltransferase family 2 protein [Rhizomicrobium sp.]